MLTVIERWKNSRATIIRRVVYNVERRHNLHGPSHPAPCPRVFLFLVSFHAQVQNTKVAQAALLPEHRGSREQAAIDPAVRAPEATRPEVLAGSALAPVTGFP